MLLGGQFSVLFDSEALDRDLTSLAATGGADAQALRLRALERKILTGEKGVTPLRSVFGRDATPGRALGGAISLMVITRDREGGNPA